ncbi:hypothetical protein [Solilutibacter pythonis]|uniref:hypothetical protein n=1 Tax=Solilutibacter pythonis TaxID=2483112 RepID=UPI0011C36BFA|nr:hypothetical protein [Lysobacter pythonis]
MNMVDCIKSAFAWRVKPVKAVADNVIESEITLDAMEFEGKFFWEISYKDLEKYHDAIYGFSPEAFQYYLPGIMMAIVDVLNYDSLILSSILDMLDRGGAPSTWEKFFIDRWLGFTQEEYSVILDWLLCISEGCQDPFQEAQMGKAFDTVALLKISECATPIAKGVGCQ